MIAIIDLFTSLLVVLAFGLVLPPALKQPSKVHVAMLLLLGLTIVVNAFSGIEWFKNAVGLWTHPDLLTGTQTFNKFARPILAAVWALVLLLQSRRVPE